MENFVKKHKTFSTRIALRVIRVQSTTPHALAEQGLQGSELALCLLCSKRKARSIPRVTRWVL